MGNYLILFENFVHLISFSRDKSKSTGGPRNSRTFYLRIRLFTLGNVIQNNKFLVKNGTFYTRIHYSRSKMKECTGIYREFRGKPVSSLFYNQDFDFYFILFLHCRFLFLFRLFFIPKDCLQFYSGETFLALTFDSSDCTFLYLALKVCWNHFLQPSPPPAPFNPAREFLIPRRPKLISVTSISFDLILARKWNILVVIYKIS